MITVMKLNEKCECTSCGKRIGIGFCFPSYSNDDNIHECECGGVFRAIETKEDMGYPDPDIELFSSENLKGLDDIVASFEAGDPETPNEWNAKTIDFMRRTIFESITGLRNTYWKEHFEKRRKDRVLRD